MKKTQHTLLHIDHLHSSGAGFGIWKREQAPDRKVLVPFTLPGDTVKVTIGPKRRGNLHAFLDEVVEPAKNRIAPLCAHFGVCGGCSFQMMPYEEQLRMKEQTVQRLFAPYLTSKTTVLPIIPCTPPWQYRNKMEFSFSMNKEGEPFLGLMRAQGKGRVENIHECHLVNPWFVDALNAARAFWKESGLTAYRLSSNTGSLRTLTVREGMRTGERMVMLTVSGNPEFALTKQQINLFTAYMQDALLLPDNELSIFLRIQQIAKGQPTQFFEMHLAGPDIIREQLFLPDNMGALTFTISPSAFFQPNTRQAEILYTKALQHARIFPEAVVYDLYCGTGTLGLFAAKMAKQVVGIELSPESSLDARMNAKYNGIDNALFYTGDVGKVLEQIEKDKSHPKPDIALVDPPRAGLDNKAIQYLLQAAPKTIVYIACNPESQSRDTAALLAGGYNLQVIQPVDQFPQTPHIENIAVFERV